MCTLYSDERVGENIFDFCAINFYFILFIFFELFTRTLYSDERVGNLVMVINEPSVIPAVKSQVTLLIRGAYSNPPNHGARVVSTVLNDPKLFESW